MDTGIGATLREARNRRKVDLVEVERATKIRLRFLQAMENEQWDVLPGGAYTRGFIRTYAGYLGLDGERLAEDFRRTDEPPGGERAPRVEPVASRARNGRRRSSGWIALAVVSALVVGLLVGVGLLGDGENGSSASRPVEPAPQARGVEGPPGTSGAVVPKPGVSLQLEALGEVWVCLLDAGGEPLVGGLILEPGAEQGPFRSRRFTVAFGNGEVEMLVDGRPAEVAAGSGPVGYEIGPGGELTELVEGERPDCE